eukprot:12416894-Karenia_brevis.AAC.1
MHRRRQLLSHDDPSASAADVGQPADPAASVALGHTPSQQWPQRRVQGKTPQQQVVYKTPESPAVTTLEIGQGPSSSL